MEKIFQRLQIANYFNQITLEIMLLRIQNKVISEKLVRKIGASKCSYCDQTCHIEKENKFHMVCDMMFICPPVDYDIHVHSRLIPK